MRQNRLPPAADSLNSPAPGITRRRSLLLLGASSFVALASLLERRVRLPASGRRRQRAAADSEGFLWIGHC